jgi:hypothetical protein
MHAKDFSFEGGSYENKDSFQRFAYRHSIAGDSHVVQRSA